MNLVAQTPQSWTRASIGKYCDVQLGKMLQNDPSSEKDEYKRYLRAINIGTRGLDLGHRFSMWIRPHEAQRFLLKTGDVLVSEGGDAGRTAIFDADGEFYFQNAINRVRPDYRGKVEPDFIYYWFTSLKSAGYVQMICNVATIPHFTAEKVKAAPFAFPQVETQRRIARFLDEKTARIDALIDKKRELLDRLAEKRQALITRAVTKGLNPDAPMKPSGIEWLGDIPVHWEIQRLDRLTENRRPIRYGIVLPGPHVDDGVPIIKGGDVRPDRLKLDLLSRTTHEIDAAHSRSRLHAGDIVYSIRGSFGDVELLPPELDGINLTQDAARIAPIKDVDREWLLLTLKSDAVLMQISASAIGATIKGINIRDLRRALLPLPPRGEQFALKSWLNGRITEIDRMSDLVSKSNVVLQEYRAALIASAVTGQLVELQ